METKRVVITGIGGITAFGRDWAGIQAAFKAGKNAVKQMDWHGRFPELETQLGAPLPDYAPPAHWTRKQLRSMGRVSQLCVDAAEQALQDAGLLGDETIKNGKMGVACGSSVGSTKDIGDMGELLLMGTSRNFNANTYVRMMPHTTAANIGIFFGLTGRIIPTSSACSSGSQAIGYAYEAIKYGLIDTMLAGGGEEFCPSEVYVFDSLYAASRRNGEPNLTPRPYDTGRDGLVIGEGAGMLVLESLEHARARGAKIYADHRLRRKQRWQPRYPAAKRHHAKMHGTRPQRRRYPPRTGGLCERARHRHRKRRHRRNPRHRSRVRLCADEFAEKLFRTHAGRMRRAGSVVCR